MAKFDRAGTFLWRHNLNGTANSSDEARSVAVDNQRNVVAAGVTQNDDTFSDFTVAKFDRDGTLLWRQNINGTATNSNDQAFSVAVDNHGNVVAAGFTGPAGIESFDWRLPPFWDDTVWAQPARQSKETNVILTSPRPR